jgi:hypothetical protein
MSSDNAELRSGLLAQRRNTLTVSDLASSASALNSTYATFN